MGSTRVVQSFSVLLVLLCLQASALISRSGGLNEQGRILVPLPLDKRQDDLSYVLARKRDAQDNCLPYIGDPETPDCVALCAPSSFYCSTHPIDKRNAELRILDGSYGNSSTAVADKKPAFITKRSIQSNPLHQNDLPTYLPNQFDGDTVDSYFGLPAATVTDPETDATVFQLTQFGSSAFAIGAINVHGCTMLTVVSSSAVWMGHVWEVPTWTSQNKGNPTVFQENLLYWIGSNNQIFPADGTRLNPADFTENVRVYIMHPRRVSRGSYRTSRYSAKINMLKSTLQSLFGEQVPIVLYNYIAYDERSGVQGIALFQFDPNANGNSKPGWRLFYEQNQFRDTDPTPAPAAANGIPEEGIASG